MIDKKAYDMLVDNYADEILKEAKLNFGAARKAGGAIKSGIGRIGGGAKSGAKKTRMAVGTGVRKAKGGITGGASKAKGMYNSHYETAAQNWHTKNPLKDFDPVKKARQLKIRDGAVVGGAAVAAGTTGGLLYKHFNKDASEIVADIMEKRAHEEYEMYKEARKVPKFLADRYIKARANHNDKYYANLEKKIQELEAGGKKLMSENNPESKKWFEKANKLKESKKTADAVNRSFDRRNIAAAATLATLGLGGTGYGVGHAISGREKAAEEEYAEYIAKSAAELLVEAVMYKQAAYDQMENAQICFDAGQVALDSIDYELR